MKSRILLVLLAVTLVISSVALGACQPAAPKEAIVLRMVSFLPDRPPSNITWVHFINIVSEKAKGELVVKCIGGPETVAPPDAAGAVQKGVIEMADALWSLSDAVVPGIRCLTHMEVSYAGHRKKGGAYDFVQGLCNKAGLFYLGQAKAVRPQSFLYLYTNKRVEKPEDFAGLKMGTPSPLSIPYFKALGATPVVIPLHEYFTAVERGVVDGYVIGLEDVPGFGLDEVTKYLVDHPYASSPDGWIVNLDVWNGLPKKLQNVLIESAIEHENLFPDYYDREIGQPARQKMLAAGMEFLTFSPADAKRYHDMYREASWAAEIEKHPDIAPQLRALITK